METKLMIFGFWNEKKCCGSAYLMLPVFTENYLVRDKRLKKLTAFSISDYLHFRRSQICAYRDVSSASEEVLEKEALVGVFL